MSTHEMRWECAPPEVDLGPGIAASDRSDCRGQFKFFAVAPEIFTVCTHGGAPVYVSHIPINTLPLRLAKA